MTEPSSKNGPAPETTASNRWQVHHRDVLEAGGAFTRHTAAMPPPGPPAASQTPASFRFGMVTDLHYADAGPLDTRVGRRSKAKLAECVERMAEHKVQFLIELGDFKDQGKPPQEKQTLTFLETIEHEFRRFPGPRYHVPGNHDFDSISKQQYLAAIRNSGIPADRTFYSFDMGGLHFVVLDNNYHADGAHYDHGGFDWTDANIPAAELEWLAADLAAGHAPVIVFSHQLYDGEGDVYVTNAPELRKVLEASKRVSAVFQGHHHPGGYHAVNGIHYYTMRAMVEGSDPEEGSYTTVDVHPGHALVTTEYRKVVGARAGSQRRDAVAPSG
ncbi:MAG: hypothetical protein GXP31_08625 [Kiritimatiellaeota bacterium]|nr:hypothetical protein [Kiritimatiellota bacterium]